jgi:hypothetical protein
VFQNFIGNWGVAGSGDRADRREILAEFNRLLMKLSRARIYKRCREEGCGKRAKWMTLPVDKKGYLASPYYWCDDHGPWEKERGISEKLPIHFDVIEDFGFDKQGQREIFQEVRGALGIPKGTRITEDKAKRFFADLSQ